MSKYDFELDLNSANSLSLIAQEIRPCTSVLEFGPASGRLTKYLSEKKCKVSIVEIDEEAGNKSIQYAYKGFIGKEQGDIENYYWADNLDELFDYIIFADVLEHLKYPDEVLERCKEYLAPEGSILISIPNIAHNSIIIDLINDEFHYNELGLLDNTHLRFYTYKSFRRLLDKIGLVPIGQKAICLDVGENEINNQYTDVTKSIQSLLAQRNRGIAYQYVFKVIVQREHKFMNYDKLSDELQLVGKKNLEMTIYISEDNSSYNEIKKTSTLYASNEKSISINLSAFNNITGIRLDPMEKSCIIRVKHIHFLQNDMMVPIGICETNASYKKDNVYFFDTQDPQLYLDVVSAHIDNVCIEFEVLDFDLDDLYLSLLKEKDNMDKKTGKCLHELEIQRSNLLETKRNVDNLNLVLSHNNSIISDYRMQIEDYKKIKERLTYDNDKLTEFIVDKDNIIRLQQQDIELLKSKIVDLEKQLTKILNHKLWRFITRFVKY